MCASTEKQDIANIKVQLATILLPPPLSCFYLHHWIPARRSGWSDVNSKCNTSTCKMIAHTKNKHIIPVVKKNKLFLDCMTGSSLNLGALD